MSLSSRGRVFFAGTLVNAVLFVFYSRVVLTVTGLVNDFGTGPATPAIEMIPQAVVVAMLALQIGVTGYFLGAFGQQRKAQRRPQ
jgi:hypothetical protein